MKELKWNKVSEKTIPENRNVIAYNEKWISEDINPDGIRIGFMLNNVFYSAEWDEHGDDFYGYGAYVTKEDNPTHWSDLTLVVNEIKF